MGTCVPVRQYLPMVQEREAVPVCLQVRAFAAAARPPSGGGAQRNIPAGRPMLVVSLMACRGGGAENTGCWSAAPGKHAAPWMDVRAFSMAPAVPMLPLAGNILQGRSVTGT